MNAFRVCFRAFGVAIKIRIQSRMRKAMADVIQELETDADRTLPSPIATK